MNYSLNGFKTLKNLKNFLCLNNKQNNHISLNLYFYSNLTHTKYKNAYPKFIDQLFLGVKDEYHRMKNLQKNNIMVRKHETNK